jgi:hypothetical protein
LAAFAHEDKPLKTTEMIRPLVGQWVPGTATRYGATIQDIDAMVNAEAVDDKVHCRLLALAAHAKLEAAICTDQTVVQEYHAVAQYALLKAYMHSPHSTYVALVIMAYVQKLLQTEGAGSIEKITAFMDTCQAYAATRAARMTSADDVRSIHKQLAYIYERIASACALLYTTPMGRAAYSFVQKAQQYAKDIKSPDAYNYILKVIATDAVHLNDMPLAIEAGQQCIEELDTATIFCLASACINGCQGMYDIDRGIKFLERFSSGGLSTKIMMDVAKDVMGNMAMAQVAWQIHTDITKRAIQELIPALRAQCKRISDEEVQKLVASAKSLAELKSDILMAESAIVQTYFALAYQSGLRADDVTYAQAQRDGYRRMQRLWLVKAMAVAKYPQARYYYAEYLDKYGEKEEAARLFNEIVRQEEADAARAHEQKVNHTMNYFVDLASKKLNECVSYSESKSGYVMSVGAASSSEDICSI